MKWTLFWDMHSGGRCKEEPYEKIYIEAPEEEAKVIFYNRFGHSADRVSCTCCGADYSVDEHDSLEQVSAFHRGCAWDEKKKKYVEKSDGTNYEPYRTLNKYLKDKTVLVIRASKIKKSERLGSVPEQGYIYI